MRFTAFLWLICCATVANAQVPQPTLLVCLDPKLEPILKDSKETLTDRLNSFRSFKIETVSSLAVTDRNPPPDFVLRLSLGRTAFGEQATPLLLVAPNGAAAPIGKAVAAAEIRYDLLVPGKLKNAVATGKIVGKGSDDYLKRPGGKFDAEMAALILKNDHDLAAFDAARNGLAVFFSAQSAFLGAPMIQSVVFKPEGRTGIVAMVKIKNVFDVPINGTLNLITKRLDTGLDQNIELKPGEIHELRFDFSTQLNGEERNELIREKRANARASFRNLVFAPPPKRS